MKRLPRETLSVFLAQAKTGVPWDSVKEFALCQRDSDGFAIMILKTVTGESYGLQLKKWRFFDRGLGVLGVLFSLRMGALFREDEITGQFSCCLSRVKGVARLMSMEFVVGERKCVINPEHYVRAE